MLSFSDQYVLIAAAASFIFGYQVAVLNTSLSFFTLAFKTCGDGLTYTCDEARSAESITNAMVFVGAAVGSLVAGRLISMGRRLSLFVTHGISVLGALLCCFAPSYLFLTIGRAVVGLCVGLSTVVPPTIISEMCTNKSRGSRGVLHQLGITSGIFVAIVLGLFLTLPPQNQNGLAFETLFVRFMQLLPGLLSSVVILLMVFVYTADTPLSLLEQGKSKQAMGVLQKIHGSPTEAEDHFEEIAQQLAERTSTAGSINHVGFMDIFRTPCYLRAFGIGCLLSIGQQLGGINVFVSLSNKLFTAAGLPASSASIASTVMAIINMVMTFPALLVIDSLGRKPLLLIGTAGQSVCLSIVPLMYLFGATTQIAIGAVIAVVGYIMFFALAQGPVLWVYLFEMYPPEIKGLCTGIASSLNWLSAVTIVWTNTYFSDDKYTVGKFVFFTAVCTASMVFILVTLKETKGCGRSPYMPLENEEETVPLEVKLPV